MVGPLVAFSREYERYTFTAALHDNYYRRYGEVLAYYFLNFPARRLRDVGTERSLFIKGAQKLPSY